MAATSIQRALDGTDEEISYDGTSQYASGGVSACGLAAMNFARSLFTEESKGRKGRELLSVVVGRDNMEASGKNVPGRRLTLSFRTSSQYANYGRTASISRSTTSLRRQYSSPH